MYSAISVSWAPAFSTSWRASAGGTSASTRLAFSWSEASRKFRRAGLAGLSGLALRLRLLVALRRGPAGEQERRLGAVRLAHRAPDPPHQGHRLHVGVELLLLRRLRRGRGLGLHRRLGLLWGLG